MVHAEEKKVLKIIRKTSPIESVFKKTTGIKKTVHKISLCPKVYKLLGNPHNVNYLF